MAKNKNDNATGKQVRRAYDGPDIEHDQLLGRIGRWNGEDAQRASSAAETRAEIGQFTEKTGMNPKALSVLRSIKKIADKSQDKAMDFIRSLEKGLPMIKADIGGQQGEMNLDDDDPLEPASDEPIRPETTDAEWEQPVRDIPADPDFEATLAASDIEAA